MEKVTNKLLDKKQIQSVIDILSKEYSDANCGLDYTTPLELTVSLILAAQCTDKRVNIISPILFNKYPDVISLSKARLGDIEKIIEPCGFYHNKAKNILATANMIIHDFDGSIPSSMEELTTLAGIGRKSANIILQECFSIVDGIAVDTHVARLSKRIGLTNNTLPLKIEQDLMRKLPLSIWDKINHIFVCHGRAICDAKKPQCNICPIKDLCRKNKIATK